MAANLSEIWGSTYCAVMGMIPFEPTPTGMWSNMHWASCSLRGATSFSIRLVRSRRTPQLMSNPTPPGETTASLLLMSKAAIFPTTFLTPFYIDLLTKKKDSNLKSNGSTTKFQTRSLFYYFGRIYNCVCFFIKILNFQTFWKVYNSTHWQLGQNKIMVYLKLPPASLKYPPTQEASNKQ